MKVVGYRMFEVARFRASEMSAFRRFHVWLGDVWLHAMIRVI